MNDIIGRSLSDRASIELGERVGRSGMAWLLPKINAAERRVREARTALAESEAKVSATEVELFEGRSQLDAAQAQFEVLRRRVQELQEELDRRPIIDPSLAEEAMIRVMDQEWKAAGLPE